MHIGTHFDYNHHIGFCKHSAYFLPVSISVCKQAIDAG